MLIRIKYVILVVCFCCANASAQKSAGGGIVIPPESGSKPLPGAKLKLLKNQTLFEKREAGMFWTWVCSMPRNKPCKKGTEVMLFSPGLLSKDNMEMVNNLVSLQIMVEVEAFVDPNNEIDRSKPFTIYPINPEK